MSLEKDILGEFLGNSIIAHHAPYESVDRSLVALDQTGECPFFSGARAADQFALVHFSAAGRLRYSGRLLHCARAPKRHFGPILWTTFGTHGYLESFPFW